MNLSDRIRIARANVVLEARRMVQAHPGEFPAMESFLEDLHAAHVEVAKFVRVLPKETDHAS